MRLRGLVGFWVLLFAMGSPALLLAQFQAPTQEELHMTADPQAPGASAVYLYREDFTDQPDSTRTFYERIKVLTEKGKELATVHIPYVPGSDKVADVQGRTIHADGTVVPLTDKPSDLVDLKTKGFQLNSLVFTLPSAEVGSILEYRVKLKYSDGPGVPTWMIQQTNFVHKALYTFKGYGIGGLSYVAKMGNDAKVISGKKNTYTLDVHDIPALPDDDWMPPLNLFKWKVSFFYSDYKSQAAYWEEAGKNWSTVIRETIDPSGGLKKAVAELVAPGDSETQKAQKIYAAMMKLENTDFTRQRSEVERKKEKIKEIKTVEDVWKQQTGSSDDIALLYVAMCRAAGLKMDPMKVVDRSLALYDENLLSDRQFDDYIAVGQLDGKEVFLDPGEKLCPFGMLHWKHTVASGMRLSEKAGVVAHTSSANYKVSSVRRVADLTVEESGGVSGSIRYILTDQNALQWRQLTLQNDGEEVKKRFNESMKVYVPEGVQVDFDHFLGLDQYEANLIGVVRVSGTLDTSTGKRFFLPGLFFESRAKHPFVAEEKRVIPVDVHFPRTDQDDVTYHLPPDYAVESVPQSASLSWPEHAMLKVATDQSGGSVRVARTLVYNYTILDSKEYSGLHDFYPKGRGSGSAATGADSEHDGQGKLISGVPWVAASAFVSTKNADK
jgi:hypothetical protein